MLTTPILQTNLKWATEASVNAAPNRLNDMNFCKAPFLWLLAAMLILTTVEAAHNTAVAAPKSKLIEHWEPYDAASEIFIDHSVWQGLLEKYVSTDASGMNEIDYAGVTEADFSVLNQYLTYLQAINPSVLNRDEQFAYWVNLYNAKTFELVSRAVQERGITSIRQIRSNYIWPGPWSKSTLLVNGKKMSLNDLEHGVLRPIWQDYRIHYAVNCASIGCPNLQKTAYTANNTEALLQKAELQFLTHPRALSYENGVLTASKIFSWYQSDFAPNKDELLNYFRRFIDLGEPSQKVKIVYSYDWNLNIIN